MPISDGKSAKADLPETGGAGKSVPWKAKTALTVGIGVALGIVLAADPAAAQPDSSSGVDNSTSKGPDDGTREKTKSDTSTRNGTGAAQKDSTDSYADNSPTNERSTTASLGPVTAAPTNFITDPGFSLTKTKPNPSPTERTEYYTANTHQTGNSKPDTQNPTIRPGQIAATPTKPQADNIYDDLAVWENPEPKSNLSGYGPMDFSRWPGTQTASPQTKPAPIQELTPIEFPPFNPQTTTTATATADPDTTNPDASNPEPATATAEPETATAAAAELGPWQDGWQPGLHFDKDRIPITPEGNTMLADHAMAASSTAAIGPSALRLGALALTAISAAYHDYQISQKPTSQNGIKLPQAPFGGRYFLPAPPQNNALPGTTTNNPNPKDSTTPGQTARPTTPRNTSNDKPLTPLNWNPAFPAADATTQTSSAAGRPAHELNTTPTDHAMLNTTGENVPDPNLPKTAANDDHYDPKTPESHTDDAPDSMRGDPAEATEQAGRTDVVLGRFKAPYASVLYPPTEFERPADIRRRALQEIRVSSDRMESDPGDREAAELFAQGQTTIATLDEYEAAVSRQGTAPSYVSSLPVNPLEGQLGHLAQKLAAAEAEMEAALNSSPENSAQRQEAVLEAAEAVAAARTELHLGLEITRRSIGIPSADADLGLERSLEALEAAQEFEPLAISLGLEPLVEGLGREQEVQGWEAWLREENALNLLDHEQRLIWVAQTPEYPNTSQALDEANEMSNRAVSQRLDAKRAEVNVNVLGSVIDALNGATPNRNSYLQILRQQSRAARRIEASAQRKLEAAGKQEPTDNSKATASDEDEISTLERQIYDAALRRATVLQDAVKPASFYANKPSHPQAPQKQSKPTTSKVPELEGS